MKITESKLRMLIRNVIAESMYDDEHSVGTDFEGKEFEYDPRLDPLNPEGHGHLDSLPKVGGPGSLSNIEGLDRKWVELERMSEEERARLCRDNGLSQYCSDKVLINFID